jgi:hypothetical protein
MEKILIAIAQAHGSRACTSKGAALYLRDPRFLDHSIRACALGALLWGIGDTAAFWNEWALAYPTITDRVLALDL